MTSRSDMRCVRSAKTKHESDDMVDLVGQEQTELLFARMATELQQLPGSAQRTARVASVVAANNARVAEAGLVLLRMEDHPGTFDPWCRTFAALGEST